MSESYPKQYTPPPCSIEYSHKFYHTYGEDIFQRNASLELLFKLAESFVLMKAINSQGHPSALPLTHSTYEVLQANKVNLWLRYTCLWIVIEIAAIFLLALPATAVLFVREHKNSL